MARVVEDCRDSSGKWIRTYTVGEQQYQTRSYSVWYSMIQRCKPGSYTQESNPTYKDCTTSEGFQDFQTFAEWYTSQVGYGCKNYELDKDILFPGNKVYSEDTCCLVPQGLNTFLVRPEHTKELPIGVYYRKDRDMYRAQIRFDNKSIVVGLFNTVEEAASAYKRAKEKFAHTWWQRLQSGQFPVESKVVERMQNWQFH